MMKLVSKGNFDHAEGWLKKLKEGRYLRILNKYGELGVKALSEMTPVDSGVTASSWRYEIQNTDSGIRLAFWNTNENDNVLIAIILQYGHATGTGGWVEGIDYINPAIRPVFDELARNVWWEVTKI